jgi:membrane protein implicated in regulation of membrane protease activity
MKPFYRYLLFQVPGWLTVAAVMGFLHATAGISASLAVGVVVFMIALDFVLYPFFRHSYASGAQAGPETLIGARGRVTRALDPAGMVRIRGERWKAVVEQPGASAKEGDTVEVIEIRGLTLIVRRAGA